MYGISSHSIHRVYFTYDDLSRCTVGTAINFGALANDAVNVFFPPTPLIGTLLPDVLIICVVLRSPSIAAALLSRGMMAAPFVRGMGDGGGNSHSRWHSCTLLMVLMGTSNSSYQPLPDNGC